MIFEAAAVRVVLFLAGWLDNTEQSFLRMVEENNF